ncbi:MAG TPA: hypothetical protein VGW10_07215 [Solirubrobacteraceae bacterium]|nr:hypothetical protein [Solirubrobacteraceae bacterium]
MGVTAIRRAGTAAFVAAAACLLAVVDAPATPVASNEQERAAYGGRVFPEPIRSVDYINHGPTNGPEELKTGFELLERLYPGYLEFTTVAEELGDPNAVSLGPDGKPAWDPADAKDGYPFYVAKVTDESVPDRDKGYVLLLNAHPAEPCGQEGSPRFLEDLLIWRETDPGHVLDDGSGLFDKPHRITVAELLKKVKVYFVSPSPDGWAGGDGPGTANNGNNAGFNSNRVAYQDGWVFPAKEELFERGYSSLTQPEGSAVTKYLTQVREKELGGRPWAVANDQHGPVPTSGAIIFHDQGSDAAKIDRVHDYGRRLEENMEEVLARYMSGEGVNASQAVAREAGSVRDTLLQIHAENIGPVSEKAAYLTLEWAEYATAWEHLDYTVVSSWGGWAGSRSGLDADSISFETACRPFAAGFDPALFQLFVDNVRAANETGVVHAAQRAGRTDEPEPSTTYDLRGRVGFVETGRRITDADGNPSPPPLGHPGTPLLQQVRQAAYDVSSTDWFRDARRIVENPIVEVPAADVARRADELATLAVADATEVDAGALKRFAEDGGNLVLTDGALQLLPSIAGVPAGSVRKGTSYVGYSDLDRKHPWTEGMYKRARQTFDPVGLGYPLLMERDQYWPCNPDSTCDVSGTENSAPIWTVDRAAWEKQGGATIATADPPGGTAGGEGTARDKTSIGTLRLGKGRVAILGAILPQPSEDFDHWFGLNPYTVSIPGQQLLLNALRWDQRPAIELPASGAPGRRCRSRRNFTIRLREPRRGRLRSARVYVNGRRVRVLRGKRLRARVDLRGLPEGRYTVKIVARTTTGRRIVAKRRYRTCRHGLRRTRG